jgi:hypothetical protein
MRLGRRSGYRIRKWRKAGREGEMDVVGEGQGGGGKSVSLGCRSIYRVRKWEEAGLSGTRSWSASQMNPLGRGRAGV